ncbi:MAG: hypothetical protein KGN80_06055 [Acidobacteriota bacterium]|nr:hypothetical protein [Acidobacteriota bacterium]
MKRKALLLASLVIGLVASACGRPDANRVVIVNPNNGSFTVTGASPVAFGITAGVFQPQLCEERNVFVYRGDACACGFPGKAGHAYQVQKDGKLKDVGLVDLEKPDVEIAGIFGIKKTEPLQKHSFSYPLVP